MHDMKLDINSVFFSKQRKKYDRQKKMQWISIHQLSLACFD